MSNETPCTGYKAEGKSLGSILGHFPVGVAWVAARIRGKNQYKLIEAISQMFEDFWDFMCHVITELNPYTTTELISEWETALSLPDPCLPPATSLAERRAWLVFRLTKKRWTTLQDWYDLAELFGVDLMITPGSEIATQYGYPFCYEYAYGIDFGNYGGRFQIYMDLQNCVEDGYVYDYSFNYSGLRADCALFRCLIERIKPANVIIIWGAAPDYC